MRTELVPLNGDPPLEIARDVTLVGRRDYCDLVVPHPSLSKRHCLLVKTDGLLIVRDLISTNGTKVNGQRVAWAALMPDDRLTLGRVKFRVIMSDDKRRALADASGAMTEHATLVGLDFEGVDRFDAAGFEAPSPPRFQAIRAAPSNPPASPPFLPAPEGLELVDQDGPIDLMIELDSED